MRVQIQLQRKPFLFTTLGASAAILAASPVFAQNNNGGNGNNGGNNGGNNNNNNNDDNEDEDAADPPPAATEDPEADDPAATEPPAEDEDDAADDPEPAPEPEPEPESTTASEEDEPTSTTEEPEPEETTTTEEATTTTEEEEDEPTSTMTTEEAETTTAEPTETETGTGDSRITASLTRGFGIPTYPAAAVPPTYHAPFMQHSRAPDGTVFIAVGAILGAFGLGILLWRVIVGLLLHRSVERAARAQHESNDKAGFPAPPAPFYKYTDQGSNMSLSGSGAAAGRGVRRTNRGNTPSANPSMSNLFFSPTAVASNNGGNRNSTYLPSGFYAAGSGSGNGNAQHGHSISLTNLRPDSRGQGASRSANGVTPPDSPAFPARRDLSSTSLNQRPGSQRAPSAYLDDLLADDPGALPPPHMPPSNGLRHSSSNLGPGSNRL